MNDYNDSNNIMIVIQFVSLDLFDKEYQLCLQRLPKELAVLLQSWDYSPSAKACHCRKEFGLLKVF